MDRDEVDPRVPLDVGGERLEDVGGLRCFSEPGTDASGFPRGHDRVERLVLIAQLDEPAPAAASGQGRVAA